MPRKKINKFRKTVLITGSSKGLGNSLALAFASKGYNIILHGRNKKRLNMTRKKVLENKVKCQIVKGDLSKKETITKLIAKARETGINILINNAGIYVQGAFEKINPYKFRRIIEVNLIAPVLLTKGIFKLLKKKREGLIININSIAGKNYNGNEAAYCTSKYGLRGFMGSFQFEALKYNISVINLYLGAMATGITKGRKDTRKFIKTEEVAKFISSLPQNYTSMRISEIEILRKLY